MDELQPGDKVVDLGALLRSVTVATGAVSAALLLFLARQNTTACLGGFVMGAASGLVAGHILSRLLYADGRGNVTVVKAEAANLPATLGAALKGAIFQSALVLGAVGLAGKIAFWPASVLAALGVSLLAAFLFARLSLS